MIIIEITILYIASLVLLSVSGDNGKQSEGETQEKGKFRLVTESTYSVSNKSGEPQKTDLKEKLTHKYDEKGNEIELTHCTKGSFLTTIVYNNHDEKGFPIESSHTYKMNDGSINRYKFTTNYSYNKKDQVIKEVEYRDGKINSMQKFKYDRNGNRVEWLHFEPDGNLFLTLIFKYDENDQMIEDNAYSADGSYSKKNYYKYGEKGNLIERSSYGSDSGLENKFTYTYHNFDKAGNWLKKIVFQDDKPIEIIERVIEYY
jgi:hypothetical protein